MSRKADVECNSSFMSDRRAKLAADHDMQRVLDGYAFVASLVRRQLAVLGYCTLNRR